MDIVKTAAVGIGAVLLAMLFRQQKPEFSMMIHLACGVFTFTCVRICRRNL